MKTIITGMVLISLATIVICSIGLSFIFHLHVTTETYKQVKNIEQTLHLSPATSNAYQQVFTTEFIKEKE